MPTMIVSEIAQRCLSNALKNFENNAATRYGVLLIHATFISLSIYLFIENPMDLGSK